MQFVVCSYGCVRISCAHLLLGLLPTADFPDLLLAFAQQYWTGLGPRMPAPLLEIIFARKSSL